MDELDRYTPAALFARLEQDGALERVLRAARDEDLDEGGDVTTASIVPDGLETVATLAAREDGVVAGLRAVEPAIRVFGGAIAPLRYEGLVADGEGCVAGDALGRLHGALAAILPLERTVLNLVGRLSGIATLTRRFVDAVHGTNAVICATRKTAPGLRRLDKYAASCGGGRVHRQGLFDAALYKDNHLAHVPPASLAATLARAIRAARATRPLRFVQVEVDTLAQLDRVLRMEPGLVDLVLLDNMTTDELREAVAARDGRAAAGRAGGVGRDHARDRTRGRGDGGGPHLGGGVDALGGEPGCGARCRAGRRMREKRFHRRARGPEQLQSGDRGVHRMDWREHITVDPRICHGQACFRGTRVMVSVVLENLATSMSVDEILGSSPSLTRESVQAAVAYAAELAGEQVRQLPA